MFDLFGMDLPWPVKLVVAFVVVLGLILAVTWLLRRFGGTRLGTAAARGRQPRLAVIDAASVDARRRLVLIRRDNVEHLVLIGGPTDIVVEQNIVRAVPVAAPREAAPGRPHLDAPPREAPPRAPEPRQPEPHWAQQPEPAARMARPAEPRQAEPAWTQPEPPPRPARPAEPKAPPVDLPQRPLPEPVTAALRAGSAPERVAPERGTSERMAPEPPRAARPSPVRAPAPPPAPPAPPPVPAALEPEQPVEVRQSPPTADVNLADMAQRLEAALRRPAGGRLAESRAPSPRTDPRPPREPARPTPPLPAVAAPAAPASEPRPAPEMPRATTIVEPPAAAPAAEPPKPAEAAAEPPAPRSVFASLEEEMANLLKPTGKP